MSEVENTVTEVKAPVAKIDAAAEKAYAEAATTAAPTTLRPHAGASFHDHEGHAGIIHAGRPAVDRAAPGALPDRRAIRPILAQKPASSSRISSITATAPAASRSRSRG